MGWSWVAALLLAGVYCLIRAIVDFRQKRYLWAAGSLAAALVILCAPIPTHSIVIDLPVDSAPR